MDIETAKTRLSQARVELGQAQDEMMRFQATDRQFKEEVRDPFPHPACALVVYFSHIRCRPCPADGTDVYEPRHHRRAD